MLLLVVLIAVANLALGYATAVALGFGPPGAAELWLAVNGQPALRRRPALPPTPFETPLLAPSPPPAPATTETLTCMLDSGAEDDFMPDMFTDSYDDDAAGVVAQLNPDGPELWDLGEKYVETSILRLNVAMMKSGARATTIDTRLRACRGQTDSDTVQECLTLLQQDCEAYLAEQSAAAEKFRSRIEELGELKSMGEDIEMANLDQAAQIETTLSNLMHMDFASDLEAANARLLQEIHLLRGARHRLRDSQEIAFLTIARYQNRLDKIERALFTDPLTRLRNRIGLETTMWDWWQEGRHQSRQMSAALWDVDAFSVVNERRGSLLGDKVIFQLAQTLQGGMGEADLVSRFAGQRFLAMFLDIGPRAAIKKAEMLRQSIERTTFVTEAAPISLTVSAGLTEVKGDDTFETVVARLEAALKEAKQAGGNRACLHNGSAVEPVESPSFGAEHKEIQL